MPSPTAFEKLAVEVRESCRRYEILKDYYQRFCVNARLLANDSRSPVEKPLSAPEGDVLLLEIADRKLQVSVRFNLEAFEATLHAQETYTLSPERAAETVVQIPFDRDGATGIAAESGRMLTLDQDGDCKFIALSIIDSALKRQPQK